MNSSETSLAFGYSFNAEDFGTEAAAISSILAEKLPMLNVGEVDDVDAAVAELEAALEVAGIDSLVAANQEQLNAYLGK